MDDILFKYYWSKFLILLEKAKAGKYFTGGEFIKNGTYDVSQIMFKDKINICKKIKELPLLSKTVKEQMLTIFDELSDILIVYIILNSLLIEH